MRPEQLELSRDSANLSARVIGVSFHGHDATVRLKACTSDSACVELLARVPGFALPSVGETVTIAVRGEVVAYVASPDAAGAHSTVTAGA
jgi:iron(III) transport system ATP-binding protein